MDITALLLSRLQFAFTVSFHIIFPSFTIGLAAWLTVLEALRLLTGRPAYRVVFESWLKIFGVAFGFGVASGIVMPATPRVQRRGAHHAAHGLVSRCRARAGPDLLRTLNRRLRAQLSAGEIRSDRGPLARRAAGGRGADRDPQPGH